MVKFHCLWLACNIVAAAIMAVEVGSSNIGVNWGTQMSQPINPPIVVQMLKDNGINKVKLFDADSWTMDSLVKSEMEVMVGIPNFDLERMNDYGNAQSWVKENITAYLKDDHVNIKYVAVGNEPFLTSYNGSFLHSTLPAMKNIQKALDEAEVGNRIKAITPLNADVYGSPSDNNVPSAGDWRSDIHDLMIDVVKFLDSTGAPFVVNIYPFLSLQQNKDFPIDFAFFDGTGTSINDKNLQYTNVFDANFDTLIWSLRKSKFGNMKIVVGEAGWPTDGDKNANNAMAKRFYEGLLKKLGDKKGTPMRPGEDLEVYLFGLVDENAKSIMPGNFERHWGIFSYDGQPKFPMDLSGKGGQKYLTGAKGVQHLPNQWCVFNSDSNADGGSIAGFYNYACSLGDCTRIVDGGSCSNMDKNLMLSYAYNMYYQMQDQDVRACDFGGSAKIVKSDPSPSACLFPIAIVSAGEKVGMRVGTIVGVVIGVMMMVLI